MPIQKVEIKEFPLTKEAMDVEVQDQNKVDLLFPHQVYHPTSICTPRDHC
jgi:hypothetical protein